MRVAATPPHPRSERRNRPASHRLTLALEEQHRCAASTGLRTRRSFSFALEGEGWDEGGCHPQHPSLVISSSLPLTALVLLPLTGQPDRLRHRLRFQQHLEIRESNHSNSLLP